MGKGAKLTNSSNSPIESQRKIVTYDEFKKHNMRDDQWLLINGKAYDVTQFGKRHPGGAKIINHHAGEDATDAWVAFHNDKVKVGKFLASLYVADVVDVPESSIKEDFRRLRQLAEESGWFQQPWPFFAAHLAHLVFLELLAVWMLWFFGNGWVPTLVAMVMVATSQAQAGWTQHDYGHHSVFQSMKWAHVAHQATIGFFKGASSKWWNFRHFQHHAKPNRIKKDPDIELAFLFLLGDKLPVEWGKKKRGYMPYQWQQDYFFLLGPPLLLPVYFHFENIYFCLKRGYWLDLAMAFAFFCRIFYFFSPFFGGWGAFAFYMGMRCIESHWFTWVTQMSHLPMDVDRDTQEMDWVNTQLLTTCNVDPSAFNDWFTGHLNFQIEHHLFPTMPRANYHKVKPLVESLCRKHNIPYISKPLFTAFADIVRMLKKSGQLWYDAYHE